METTQYLTIKTPAQQKAEMKLYIKKLDLEQKINDRAIKIKRKVEDVLFMSDSKKIESFFKRYHAEIKPRYWIYISQMTKLSESFMTEFADQLDWTLISAFQNKPHEFMKHFNCKINWYSKTFNEETDQKLKQNKVMKIKLFENPNLTYFND